jgi:hypothetical protein
MEKVELESANVLMFYLPQKEGKAMDRVRKIIIATNRL